MWVRTAQYIVRYFKSLKKSTVIVLALILFGFLYIQQGSEGVFKLLLSSTGSQNATFSSTKSRQRAAVCGMDKNYFSTPTRKDWDFRLFKRPEFLKNFKNPCFVRSHRQNNSATSRFKLQCLPYFIIAGFPKAGTTDLWNRLLNHPDIALVHMKEPRFFNIGRYLEGNFLNAAEKYISLFDRTAYEIQRKVAPLECDQHPFPYYHAVTGEATVDTVFDNRFWPLVPGNEHCSEPIVTNADYVRHINPDMKVIFMLRNPVERLYSDYIYEARFLHYPISRHLFHEAVIEAINNHTECRKQASVRACAYNNTVESYKVRLRVGMYSIFLSDWLEVFPQENILVVKSEDTLGPNKFKTYEKILKFLNIRPFTKLEEILVFQRGPTNIRSPPEKDLGDMLAETRSLVQNFYKEFNAALAKMYPDIDYNSQ